MGCSSSTSVEAPASSADQQATKAPASTNSDQVSSQAAAGAIGLDDISLGDREGVIMNPAAEELSAAQFENGKEVNSWSDGAGTEGRVLQPGKKATESFANELRSFLTEVEARPDSMKKQVAAKRRQAANTAKVAEPLKAPAIAEEKARGPPGQAEGDSDSESLSQ
eukprot:TRINITY_DN16390_c0_g1_i2.p1 TRINITY_DN16390_c0_g1~~TRINITY_DN16390_c0_g1_i2.p1  ORF type:complete len:166 (+),score=41.50 TRINITY_DN16390_c0_g1_i2:275-772(+)